MPYEKYSPQEVAQRGEAIYHEIIQSKIAADDKGKIVIIDIETGEYEMDWDEVAATDRAMEKRPGAVLYGMRIGSPTAHTMGRILIGDQFAVSDISEGCRLKYSRTSSCMRSISAK